MENILILETSTEVCSVAIAQNGQLIGLIESDKDYSHTQNLTLQIEEVLKAAKLSIKDLSAVALSAGPGSYTGLRVGSSTAKGICFGLNIPLISLDSLKGLSYSEIALIPNRTNYIFSMIDARRDEVYAAVFDPNHHVLEPIQAIILDKQAFSPLRKSKAVWHLVGNGAPKAMELLSYSDVVLGTNKSSAAYFVKMAHNAFLKKDFVDLAYFTPNYHKAPNITVSNKLPFA